MAIAPSVMTAADIDAAGGDSTARLAARLRAASAAARLSNPFINLPMIPPVAWAASTAIFRGEVRLANGNWYVAVQAGTTASTGSGPTSVLAASTADGTVLWTYLGPPTITTADALAPTITQSSTDPATGNPTDFGLAIKPGLFLGAFRLYGAYPAIDGSNRLVPTGFNRATGTNPAYSVGRRIAFFTDAQKITVNASGSNANSNWRIAVDNQDGKGSRFITQSGISIGAGAYISIDFGTARSRLVTLYLSPSSYDILTSVEVSANSQIWAPSSAGDLMAVLIGDSLVDGSGNGPAIAGNDVANQLSARTGIADVRPFATGGTGEINPASSQFTFSQRIPEALLLNPDIWIIMGSVNDKTYASATLSATVQATMQAIRDGGSKAPIVRVGAWPLINDATIATAETSIKAGYDAFAAADPYKHAWVGLTNATPQPWITWPFNSPSGSLGSNNTRFLASDGHPADIGTSHEARRLSEAVMQALT